MNGTLELNPHTGNHLMDMVNASHEILVIFAGLCAINQDAPPLLRRWGYANCRIDADDPTDYREQIMRQTEQFLTGVGVNLRTA